MEPIDALEMSWKPGASLVAGLRPADLAAPTPCAGWDVRALLNHTLGEAQMMTEVNNGMTSSNDHGDLVGDGADLVAAWDTIAQDNVTSWRASGLDGDRSYFYGTFPATACVIINLGEVLLHSWDLARATGQPYEVDAELAGAVYGLYSAIPLDGQRAGGIFGPEVVIPESASIGDRMLGLLGRTP
jgi:uncharacterized protein (TIGR03086 family)